MLKKAFLTNSSGILCSRIFGFLRDLSMANILGAGIYSDIFFVAFKFPNLFRRIFGEGAFTQSFLPNFIASSKKGAFSVLTLSIFSGILIVLSLFVMAFSGGVTRILALGFDDSLIEIAKPIVAIHFWYLLLVFWVTFFSALLQYKGHFWVSAYNTALLNIAMIVALFVARGKDELEIVYFVSYGVIIGGVAQVVLHFYPLWSLGFWRLFICGVLELKKAFFSEGNSSLGNQFGKSSHPASLWRMSNTPHSQGERIYQSTTANTRIVELSGEDSSNSVIASECGERGNLSHSSLETDLQNPRGNLSQIGNSNSPSIAEGVRGWVKSTRESSPKSSLDSNAKSSLQASNNEECDNPKSCHTEGFTPEVSKNGLPRATSCARNDNRDISAFSKPQYDKNRVEMDCHAQQVALAMTEPHNDCHAKSSDFARNDAKKQSLANKIKSELKAFFTQFLPAMLGSSTAQIASFIDTILASFLASGSISYLYYANRIFQLPLAIFAIAISTALFPMVAKSIKAGQEANAIKSMKKSFWFLCFMLIACAVGGAMLNQHIIWLLYEHGKFSRADTIECALVFAGYMVGLVPFGLARIFSLYLYATMRQALAAKISAISLGIGVGLSLIFMQFLGAFGLALAGSLSGFVLFLLTIKAFGFAKFWGIIADSKLSAFLVVFIGIEVAFLWIFISFVQIP